MTFEGPEFYSINQRISGHKSGQIIQKISGQIADHFKCVSFGRFALFSLKLYLKFKKREKPVKNDKPFLLFCSGMQLLSDLENTSHNGILASCKKMSFSGVLDIPDEIKEICFNQAKRKVTHKQTIRCLGCDCLKVFGDFAEVSYKMLVDSYFETPNKEALNKRPKTETAPNPKSFIGESEFLIFNHYEDNLVTDYFKEEYGVPPFIRRVYRNITLEEFGALCKNELFLWKKALICFECYLNVIQNHPEWKEKGTTTSLNDIQVHKKEIVSNGLKTKNKKKAEFQQKRKKFFEELGSELCPKYLLSKGNSDFLYSSHRVHEMESRMDSFSSSQNFGIKGQRNSKMTVGRPQPLKYSKWSTERDWASINPRVAKESFPSELGQCPSAKSSFFATTHNSNFFPNILKTIGSEGTNAKGTQKTDTIGSNHNRLRLLFGSGSLHKNLLDIPRVLGTQSSFPNKVLRTGTSGTLETEENLETDTEKPQEKKKAIMNANKTLETLGRYPSFSTADYVKEASGFRPFRLKSDSRPSFNDLKQRSGFLSPSKLGNNSLV